MKYQMRNNAGFTLIELLVVIVMIGILAVISVPDFRQYQMREQLRSSLTETKAFLSDAFAQARAQSQHQRLEILSGQQLEFCSVPQDTTVMPVCKNLKLPSGITLTTTPLVAEWRYLAPHGDVADLASDIELVFTHDSGSNKSLKLHLQSGLVEEL